MQTEKSINHDHQIQLRSLVPELLYIFALFLIVGISFVVLIFLDEKYHYLARLGAKMGKLVLNF